MLLIGPHICSSYLLVHKNLLPLLQRYNRARYTHLKYYWANIQCSSFYTCVTGFLMSMSCRTSLSSWHWCCRYALWSQVREAGRRISVQIRPRWWKMSHREVCCLFVWMQPVTPSFSCLSFQFNFCELILKIFLDCLWCQGCLIGKRSGPLNCHFTELFFSFIWTHNQKEQGWEQGWKEKLGHGLLWVCVPDSRRMLLGCPTCVTGSRLPCSVWVRVAMMPLISSP